jgi:hypothetical protein
MSDQDVTATLADAQTAKAKEKPLLYKYVSYSGEVDRPFRRNVTGDSAESAP